MQNNFLQRKQDVLLKLDKSSKGEWDEKIAELCNKINSLENFYTTSSCSGRVVIMIDQEEKENDLFINVYHNLVSFEELKKDLEKNKSGNIKFKLEPCIIHIACRSLEDAQFLLGKAKLSAWKHSGIISFGKNIILELKSTEKLEFPIIDNGKILIDDDFLRIIIKKSNEKLEKSWKKIEKLEKSLK